MFTASYPATFLPGPTAKTFMSGFPIFRKRSPEGMISRIRLCRPRIASLKPLPAASLAAI